MSFQVTLAAQYTLLSFPSPNILCVRIQVKTIKFFCSIKVHSTEFNPSQTPSTKTKVCRNSDQWEYNSPFYLKYQQRLNRHIQPVAVFYHSQGIGILMLGLSHTGRTVCGTWNYHCHITFALRIESLKTCHSGNLCNHKAKEKIIRRTGRE